MPIINKQFSDLITVSRASGGGRINPLGVFEWLGSNVPRINHSPVNLAAGNGSQTITLNNARAFAVTVVGSGTVAISGAGVDLSSMGASSGVIKTPSGSGTTDVTFSVTGNVTAVHVHEVLGILIEEQRTNLLTYSDQADNAACSKSNVTVSANAVASPDGSISADKLIEDATANWHYGSWSFSATAGSSYTISCFFKAAERSSVFLGANNVSGTLQGAAFTLSGAGSSAYWGVFSAAPTAGIQNVGNGWYRAWVTVVAASTGTMSVRAGLFSGAISYAGDGSSGAYVWGWQAELGAFLTSYIPTAAAQATRAADTCAINTLAPWFKTSEGSVFAEYDVTGVVAGKYPYVFSAAAAGNDITMYHSGVNGTAAQGSTAGVAQIFIGYSPYVAGSLRKAALAYKANDVKLVTDSGYSGADVSVALPTVASLYIGCDISGGNSLNGHIRKLRYFPKRLTDAQLQALTA